MTYQACIKDNVVVNIIVCDESFVSDVMEVMDYDEVKTITRNPGDPNIGDLYDGVNFIAAPLTTDSDDS